MGDIKAGEPFGMEASSLAKIDWKLAMKRVAHDVRSDFIYAPHLNFIYNKASEEVINQLVADLRAGSYSPGVPITVEVPKSFRIFVATQIKRLGTNFSRPGSILLPRDRLLYQALADQAASIVDTKTNHERSFSHRLGPADGPTMFLPTRTCWNELQTALKKYAKDDAVRYVVKLDIANFFGSLNQHELINVLNDSGYPKPLYSRLEAILTSFTGDRSSRGLLQGLFPSDLFGNFYLAPIDAFLEEHGVASARYVDDIYVFVKSMKDADSVLRELIPTLRGYDLTLNEAKSKILLKSSLFAEEPDLESLFSDAVDEIASQIEDEDFDADYGFQSEWDEEVETHDIELAATKILFDSLRDYEVHEETIERFCLPLFTRANSDYAVEHVIDSFTKRASMSQIYSSYLAGFLNKKEVRDTMINLLEDESLVDWQRMWILAALLQAKKGDDACTKIAFSILKNGDCHEVLRGVAAVYIGRFGQHHRRKALVQTYASVSPYIQSAIYFSARTWPGVERSNAKASWGSHSPVNALITAALTKK